MKPILSALLLIALVVSLAACTNQPAKQTESPAPSAASEPTAAPDNTPSPQETSEPEPTSPQEAAVYAPMDIFSSEFNPYGDMEHPDIFTVFAAYFSRGSAKLKGKCPFVLSMTGSGNMFAAVAYHADVAGISENEKHDRINEYLNGGFCEFQGADGTVITIRKTDPNDDRYEYVNGGCLIDITFYVGAADIEKYTNLVRDNYNLNALAPIADYLEIEPDWSECEFAVNLHKKESRVSVAYQVSDVDAAQQGITGNVESNWHDTQSGSIGMSYGMISTKIEFDNKGGTIYITQAADEFDTALSEYVEPEISLSKLGFGFDQEGTCGVYEEREPHYMTIAIHRREWSNYDGGWNIENNNQVNGYSILIWYYEGENRYDIQADKGKMSSKYSYFPAIDKYNGHYPDVDTVTQMFNDAFGTQGKDFYDKPIAHFEQLVRELFGMSVEELYALPKK